VAAYFFSKGSPRLHHWLLNHKRFGATLRDWEMDQVVRVRTKVFSTVLMIGGAGMAWWKFHEESAGKAYAIVGMFALAIVYVDTRRSKSRPECADSLRRDEFRTPVSTVR
jgi:uncharacterized membrane protein YbaN (DUF454 family)